MSNTQNKADFDKVIRTKHVEVKNSYAMLNNTHHQISDLDRSINELSQLVTNIRTEIDKNIKK